MKKLLIGLLILINSSSFAKEHYECHGSTVNATGSFEIILEKEDVTLDFSKHLIGSILHEKIITYPYNIKKNDNYYYHPNINKNKKKFRIRFKASIGEYRLCRIVLKLNKKQKYAHLKAQCENFFLTPIFRTELYEDNYQYCKKLH